MVKASEENKLRRAVAKATADETTDGRKCHSSFEKIVGNETGTWFFGHHGESVLYTRSSSRTRAPGFLSRG